MGVCCAAVPVCLFRTISTISDDCAVAVLSQRSTGRFLAMSFDDDFYNRFRHGSTELNQHSDELCRMSNRRPVAIAAHDGIIRSLESREPTIIFGGAGSGKFAHFGAYQLVHPSMLEQNYFLLDIGGQFMSVMWHWNLAMGRNAYAINPHGASAYPDINHPVHLWGFLKDGAQLFDKCRENSANILTESEMEGDNAWVGQDAKRWLTRMKTSLVKLEGVVKPNRLWWLINTIEVDNEFLTSWVRLCKDLPNAEHSIFTEIYRNKKCSEKAYSAVMGKIKSDLDWLSSKTVADSISGDDDYLALLDDPNARIGVHHVLRGGSTKSSQGYVRAVVSAVQQNCIMADKGARPLVYLEETASCGKADFVIDSTSQYRKYFEFLMVYQSLGQLIRLFGKAGAQEILENCGMQIYMGGGIRSYESARGLADSAGYKTIDVDMSMTQADRAFNAERLIMDACWNDMDMMEAAYTIEHEFMQSRQQQKQSRYAIDPAELMRLKNQVMILTPGMGLQPTLGYKLLPYWKNPAMAGRYAPDPLFPPLDRVKIKRKYFWGSKTRKFIRTPVPAHLAGWPNHSNGEVAYVEGYKTW